uniref:1-deoxy-D-xylulose-5-phosphate synthase n=1 Tax=Hanusia phi TaxID=3032 RepID=A0A7S0EK22_9CRYP|mmetsp:Transcript_25099/g.56659  ORF Transcript_25099/g.56659 Transcript_25099/m.56659 type:complete len:757 (+) Transcript_25099:50-2320(+)
MRRSLGAPLCAAICFALLGVETVISFSISPQAHSLGRFAAHQPLILGRPRHAPRTCVKVGPRMEATSEYVTKPKPVLDTVNFPSDMKKLSMAELKQLAYELRWEVIESVSKTGGHLSSSLGVTELTVALHYVFNAPEDRIVWDVAHQCYPHKMLTGRRSRFGSLRQWGGLSGFTKRKESEYDCFGAGHSSTSISAALGMSVAKDLTGKPVNNCIAVIGDGAITGGMAYEAMNCAGYLNQRMIVILNENGQVSLPTGTPSAAGVVPAGALSGSTSRILSSRPFQDARSVAKTFSKLLPEDLQKITRKIDEFGRGFVSGEEGAVLFEELGFYYLGPIDGHDLENLIPILENLRDSDSKKPVLLHVKTEKGYGYLPALKASDKMHGVAQFDIATGQQKKPKSGPPSYTTVFADTLIELARQDPTVCGITAAMPGGTGLDKFGRIFPKRTFDVGIAEQHAVTFAAGMAVDGLKPFCAIYSTFLQRGYDQVIHDCIIQSLPVRFMVDRAGLVGNDGPTHHGCFDLAYLGTLPNIVVMAPADEIELMRMVKTAHAIDDKPSVVRYPRGNGFGAEGLNKLFGYKLKAAPLPSEVSALPVGEGRIIRRADPDAKAKVAILSLGTRLCEAVRALRMIQQEGNGIGVTIADARFMKPLDKDLIRNLVQEHDVLVTVEEGAIGGFGDHVNHFLTNEGLLDSGNCRLRIMVLPDQFVEAGGQKQQYDFAGLQAKHIAATAFRALDRQGEALEVLAAAPAVGMGKPSVA